MLQRSRGARTTPRASAPARASARIIRQREPAKVECALDERFGKKDRFRVSQQTEGPVSSATVAKRTSNAVEVQLQFAGPEGAARRPRRPGERTSLARG